ncbi:Reverse transcriptase domain - like 10 [Theobroma cacao]|nr:Reverse transcriptase domain - like 10 [Theobroma cacao]
MRKKRVKSHVFQVQDSEGNVFDDIHSIQKSATDFFRNLMQAKNCDNSRFDPSLIPRIISSTDNEFLCAAPSLQEVKEAVFNINKDSVAGPDGFSSLFYQHCWDIIKHDLLDAVLDFFRGSPLPRGVTSTTLVLLPKKANACHWSEYCPISLCTFLNKIVTKLLANRLSKILPFIISKNQSGFVNGRLISDNILLAQELIGKIDAKSRGGNVVLKLDMAKAYDRLNWDFLYLMMEHFGFNAHWINMIKSCISNCWFSLLINGSLVGYFKSERGLRQGDSISLMLFILVADYLSRGLNHLFSCYSSLQYLSGCQMPISNISFADDIVIFTNGSRSALQKILSFLQEYEQVSGQQVNHQKSCFITANGCPLSRRQIISHTTGFQHKTLPVTYLGAPLHKGPKKVLLFYFLISKIRDRISGWENKILSPGGRITLLRSVLSSLPMYLLQVLKPPVTVIERIDRLFNSFLWGDSVENKKMHWAEWAKISFPCAEGGLGIRKLEDVCATFTLKLRWRFQTGNSLWTQFLRTKYCLGRIPHHIQPKLHDSHVWKRMISGREMALQNIRWKIGKGDLFFWHDCWMGDKPLAASFPEFQNDMSHVNHFYNGDTWDMDKLKSFLPMILVYEILQVPFDKYQEDVAYWTLPSNGDFSTRSAWEMIRQRNDAKHRHSGLYPDRVIWRIMKLCRQLYDGSLLQQWQWKGDTDIAAMLGLSSPPKQYAPPQIIYWKKPSIGEYKLNVDGSSRNGLHAASGGVLRDHTGKLIFGFSENIGPCNSLKAELHALLHGLLLCKERHIEKLWIEMDALVAIQLIQHFKKGPHDISYLLESIRMCLSSFSYRISHIFRERDQAADYLSNEGHNHQNLCVFTEVQGQLHRMLKLDRLNLPYVRFQRM